MKRPNDLFPAAAKKAARREAMTARDALTERERSEASAAVCAYLAELEELRGAKAILGYASCGSECDLAALYALLMQHGVTLAFPITNADGSMEAYVPSGPLSRGRFGIPEPDPAVSYRLAPEELDAVLVPCVAFDSLLNRLGRGKGYYDRYLARCWKARFVLVGYEAQRLPAVPFEEHDCRFAVLVTEQGVFRL